jgi:hypothetical protein
MAMRVKNGVEPITSPAGMDRGGSRPKPPKAVAQRASLEASRCVPDHQKAKRRLTRNTVAFVRQHLVCRPELLLHDLQHLDGRGRRATSARCTS